MIDYFEAAADEWDAILTAAKLDRVPHPDLLEAFADKAELNTWAAMKVTILGLILEAAEIYYNAGTTTSAPGLGASAIDVDTDTEADDTAPGVAAVSHCMRALGAAIDGGPTDGPTWALLHLSHINEPVDVTVAYQVASGMYSNALDDPACRVSPQIVLTVPDFDE